TPARDHVRAVFVMATKFGIVYGTATKIIRRFVEPDDDADLSSIVLKPGEALLQLPLADHPIITVAALQSMIGPPSHSGRCAKIAMDATGGTGTVVEIIRADPTVDPTLGPHRLVQSDLAAV